MSISLVTLDTAYTQNFDTLSNVAGSTTNALTIPGWELTESGGGARDNQQYAVDTGGSPTGDTYSYGAATATDRALGGLRAGTLIPLFGASFVNNTGSTITSLDIGYTGEEWRFGTAGRTDQINFEYSTNATALSTGTWTGISSLNFVTPDTVSVGAKNGNVAAEQTVLSSTISALNIPNGATFFIRWTDTDATGADDGLAVDNFSLTPHGSTGPALSIADVTRSEGNSGTTTFTFTVSLSQPAGAGGVTFDIATANGTATTADNDYVQKNLTAQTIPAGSSTYTFDVTINGDTAIEANETFFVNVTNVTGATVTDGQGIGTITNDDAVPSLSVNDVSVAEGNSGTTALTFTVSLSVVSGLTTTVNYATADGTALAGSDYTATSGTLTFAPGQTSKTVTVLVNGDTVFEANQTFALNLSGATNATIAGNQGIGTITNDDAAPTLAINDVTVSESGTATFTVTRTGATELAASVDYATADGTAVATAGGPGTPDYTATSGTLTFTPSLAATATQTFTVAITNDNVYEAVEQAVANLSNASGATIADGQGVLTVTDNDAAPTISVNDITVNENGTATFTVTLTGATALPIAVDYTTADGTAVSSNGGPGTPDYTPTSGTLTFNPSASGTQTLTVTVPLNNDTTNEPTEQFALNLSNVANGATIADAQGIATITNDDAPAPADADTTPNSVAEGAIAGTSVGLTASTGPGFTYSLTNNANGAFKINATTGVVSVNDPTKIDYESSAPSHSYTVTVQADNGAVTGSSDFAITVTNVAPTQPTDSNSAAANTVPEGAAVDTLVGVTASSSDVNGGTLTYALTANANGAFKINATTGVVSVADSNKIDYESTGPAHTLTITARASDGASQSTTQNFTITVDNAAPVAAPDSYTVNEDATLTIAAAGVLANDADPGGGSILALLDANPTHGSLNLNPNGSFTYTPVANFNGGDSFTYHAYDGALGGNTVAVNITVNPVNDAPVATNVSAAGNEDGAITGTVTATDVDNSASQLSYALVGANGGAAHGTVALNANGTFSYTPAHNFNGSDSFNFKTNDGSGDSNTATESLTINPVNDAPVNTVPGPISAESSSNTAIKGLAVNDVDAASLTTSLHVEHGAIGLGSSGGAVLTGNGTATVTLAGTPAQINAALSTPNNVVYHSAANFVGTDHLTITSNDGGSSGAGGPLSDIDSVNIDVEFFSYAPPHLASSDFHLT